MFETVVHRAFSVDMATRGSYENTTNAFKRIRDMIKLFVKTFTATGHTPGEWKTSGLFKNKTFLCLVFGLGDPCEKCGQFHVDIFDHASECTLLNGNDKDELKQKFSL